MTRLSRAWRGRGRRIDRALQDDSGATLVEFALALAVFLLIIFGLLDFGRLGYSWVMAEKAMQRAARISAARPPACPGVPDFNLRAPVPAGTVPPEFGTSCSAGANICLDPGTVSCTGDPADATASEVWDSVGGLLPGDAAVENIRFTYSYDPNLGFLGGPYVPNVTAELEGLTFRFTTPLAGLASMAGAAGSTIGGDIAYPRMSVSLPGEDLAQGGAG